MEPKKVSKNIFAIFKDDIQKNYISNVASKAGSISESYYLGKLDAILMLASKILSDKEYEELEAFRFQLVYDDMVKD